MDDDAARHAFLGEVAAMVGKAGPDGSVSFSSLREARLDRLADAIDEHLDTSALLSLISGGAPGGLPFVPPGAPRS
jgi:adenosylcobyric acid synthase